MMMDNTALRSGLAPGQRRNNQQTDKYRGSHGMHQRFHDVRFT
jgi:hypothetical protein